MTWYLALTPALLLPVFLLYRFSGCLTPSAPLVPGPQTTFDLVPVDDELSCTSGQPQAIVRFVAVFPYQTPGAAGERFDVFFALTPTDRNGPELTFLMPAQVPDPAYSRRAELHRFRGQACLDQGSYRARCIVREAGADGDLRSDRCEGSTVIDPSDPVPPPDPDMDGTAPDFNLRFQWEPRDISDPGSPILLTIQCFERK